MDEKTIKFLLDEQEARNYMIRKAHYTKLLEDEKLTDEQKTKVNDYLDDIEQRLEIIDPENKFNNPTYLSTINVGDAVLEILKGTLV